MLGMSIETVVVTMIGIVTVSAIFALARVMVQKRRNAAGKEFALLADARAVEHLARTLLANRREDLAFSDALGPSNNKQLGYGKGILIARIAVAEARGAQWAMEYGEDANLAQRRLHAAKHALVTAGEKAERARNMTFAQDPTRCDSSHTRSNG